MAEQRFCTNCSAQIDSGSSFCPSCGNVTGNTALAKTTGHIKYRNMWVRVLYLILTLGIYSIYWFYVTLRELEVGNGKERSGWLWAVLYIVPFVNLIAYWRHSFEYAEFVEEKYPGIAIFILWIVFSPVVWFLVQSDLNKAAQR